MDLAEGPRIRALRHISGEVHLVEEVGSFRFPGCYDFVRTDQRGWNLLDVMDVMTL